MGIAEIRNRIRPQRLIEDFRSVRHQGLLAPIEFRLARRTKDYQRAFTDEYPRVSLCIPTYNRVDLLMSRSLASAMAQTYPNLEIIVIGDGCTDGTLEAMAAIDDPRVIFRNIERGDYPADGTARWHIAGADAVRAAYKIATGHWITNLDDDDEYSSDRVEKLVSYAQAMRADAVFHPFYFQQQDDSWIINEHRFFRKGFVTSGSLLFHQWFKRIDFDGFRMKQYDEPGDWYRFRQFRYLGARIRKHPEPLLRHYKERQNKV